MNKVLTKSGIFQTTSEGTARTIAVNAARSGEKAILVGAREFLVMQESRGTVMAYDVADIREKNSPLIEAYRELCFEAYAAEENKSRKAAVGSTTKSSKSSNTPSRYEGLGSDWMEETFNKVFGDLMGLTKKK